ncbi:hypothetical protein [Bacillus dakarensis]|uniref:hypothetical protein n=1 Tax=Robertmurraya dakarensis TaxID=1926278 RepID=UPI000980E3B0|nr:hypothetical protein [Bacillus dakarensis]
MNNFNQNGFQSQQGLGQFTNSQEVFQPGVAGTDAQQVRQQNAQSAQGGSSFQQMGQGLNGSQQSVGSLGQFASTQAAFQPGFAGTDAQQVRQQNTQSAQGGSSLQQMGQGVNNFQQSVGGMGQFTSSQEVFQPGFAGTDAQQVRQQNAQSSQDGNGFLNS